ncbi:MAG: lactaldehyde dehydrogenase [Methanobacteriaceae archaeon]|jgi:lactaldehyde dehydrogenase|nr:lactaldehyde dehydrogenase [Methanobacteriaceae archaeon]MDO9626993.1 lactaldehyde dehydrogenase [Methanobacteriaceae archaeon]
MKMLINGNFVDSKEKIDVINPFNQDLIDQVPAGTPEDVKKAINSAYVMKNELKNFSARKISEALYACASDLSDDLEEFARLITMETGKPINAARDEVKRSIDTIKLSSEESKRIYGETVPIDAGIGGKGFMAFTLKIPLGVVGAITPFNYPLNLAIHKIAPALAAKNTVVVKPSALAPLTALKMAEIINSHFPDGALNVVTGRGSIIGDELVKSEKIDKISFTGSVETGRMISQRAVMKKITLELGGNDPLIVLEDADIGKAVEATIRGSYLYTGQVCIAVKRLIVDEPVADDFVEMLLKETKKLKMGDPLSTKTDIGPLINENAAKVVERIVSNSLKEGAELLMGGTRNGNFFEPTVLDQVTSNMKVVQDETFGPISPIIRVNGIDDAINVANDTRYGLQASIFTENIHHALKAVQEIEAGSVMVNKQSTFRTDNMPFGGFKMSGMGKEGVKYAVEDMTRTKLAVLNTR